MEHFLKLENCRTELYQWDINQKLLVLNEEISEVQFESKNFSRAVSAPVIRDDGEPYCKIPQILLEYPDDITAYAFVGGANSGYTMLSETIPMNGRKRPNSYYRTLIANSK